MKNGQSGLRIAIDYTAALQQRAGIGRYTRGLVRALSGLDANSEYVLLVSGRSDQEDGAPLPSNFQLKYLPLSHRWTTALWHRLRLPIPVDLFLGRVDVFHSPDFVLPPLLQGKKILTIHDLSFYRYPQGAEPSLLWYLKGAVSRSVTRADFIFADSQCTKSDLREIFGVPEEKIAVVYPGVDPWFQPSDDQDKDDRVRTRYGLDAPFILSVGTVEPRKNYAGLIQAHKLLRQEYKVPHQLVIAGARGWLYHGIYAEVEKSGLEKDVRFLGYVLEEDLPALYRGAEVLAFPSHYEGFGLPPLEAMACGIPVVVSNKSSLPEVVGDAALMVSPEDVEGLAAAIYRILSDSALKEKLRQKGREQAKRFRWEKSAEEVLLRYRQVAGQ